MALPSSSSDCHWNTALPGRITISTPMKPTTTAAIRKNVMRSPSSGQASSTTASGATKVTAIASATGMDFTAEKKNSVESIIITELTNCVPRRRVRSRPSPMRGMKTTATSTRCRMIRNQTISCGS